MQPLIPYFDQPVLHLGPLSLYGFGVLVALGFLVGGQIAMKRARQVGLDPDAINRLIGWLVVGTFVGGHVGYGLMYAREEYFANPVKFLYLWDGLSSFGGFLACIPIAVWFFRKNKLPLWAHLDNLAIGLTVGWFFGRMGCFVAHDHPGTATEFWLGVQGICTDYGPNVACHDLGLYEALWSIGMFGLFLLLDRRARVPGFYTALLGLAYAPVRFGLDFMRPEVTDNRWMLGLTPGQWWSMVLFVAAGVLLARRLRSGDAPQWKRDAPGTADESAEATG